MDMDRKQVSEIKNECLQMPDYIRDRIEETVQQQVKTAWRSENLESGSGSTCVLLHSKRNDVCSYNLI